jgi:hypothetical protein
VFSGLRSRRGALDADRENCSVFSAGAPGGAPHAPRAHAVAHGQNVTLSGHRRAGPRGGGGGVGSKIEALPPDAVADGYESGDLAQVAN